MVVSELHNVDLHFGQESSSLARVIRVEALRPGGTRGGEDGALVGHVNTRSVVVAVWPFRLFTLGPINWVRTIVKRHPATDPPLRNIVGHQ